MRKLFTAALFLLSFNSFAVDQHTFIYRVEIDEWVAPHTTKILTPVKLPQDMDSTHVWTGAGLCMLPGPTNYNDNPSVYRPDYNPFTEQMVLQGWLNNVDSTNAALGLTHQYYFNSAVDSQHEKCVYQSFTPENDVHMHHAINASMECKNFGDTPAYCRARLWIHYKK